MVDGLNNIPVPSILWLTDSFEILMKFIIPFLRKCVHTHTLTHFNIMYDLRVFMELLKSIHELLKVNNQLFFKIL